MGYFWLISFWVLSAIIVLPIPVRTYLYATKKVVVPTLVVIDEYIACLIAIFGLIGFYGFVYKVAIWQKEIWIAYLVIYIAYTIYTFLFSPKLKYVSELAGKKKQQLLILVGTIITLPLPASIYFYAISQQTW